jgi:hypothetical protein
VAEIVAASVKMHSQHVYEIRPRKDHRGVDLISDVLPFGRLWYGEPDAISNAVGYAKFFSRSHDAVIRVYDEAGNVIETHNTRAISKSGKSLPPKRTREKETGDSPSPAKSPGDLNAVFAISIADPPSTRGSAINL